MPPKLSAVVVAQNEEGNIERCLRSLRFADEIVVVDAYSGDRTAEIARSHGARVFSRAWDGFATQKQFAIEQAKGDWILLVDADEEASVDLAAEIRSLVDRVPDVAPAGYRVRRENFFMGAPVRHGPWRKDCNVRLFRKGKGSVSQRPVHEGIVLSGDAGTTLRAPLFHYTHQTLSESFRRLNRYTTLEASERAARRRIGLVDVAVPPLGVFLRYYIIGGCWKAGTRGFLLSAITAMYRSVLYAKTYLRQTEGRAHKTPHA